MDAAQTTMLLADYGIYAITAVLLSCVVFLYRRVGALEADMRKFLETHVESRSKMIVETSSALRHSTNALNESSSALKQSYEIQAKLANATENFGHITHILKELVDRMEKQK